MARCFEPFDNIINKKRLLASVYHFWQLIKGSHFLPLFYIKIQAVISVVLHPCIQHYNTFFLRIPLFQVFMQEINTLKINSGCIYKKQIM